MIDVETLRVGGVLIAAFLGVCWLMLTGGTGQTEVEWPAPAVVRMERVIPAAEWVIPEACVLDMSRPVREAVRRHVIHKQWCDRRAAEAPWFAELAREMGLGLALGVAA